MILIMFVAAAMVGALLLFALAGGADFGAGMWTVLSRGEESRRLADLVDRAIGPIWEANELWVVVAVVIMWCGFPSVFAALGITLFIPLILVLFGILLRGAFFAFQEHSDPGRYLHQPLGKVFGAVSFIAPLFFGLSAGAVSSGRLVLQETNAGRFATFTPEGGYFQAWLGLFPLVTGLLALVTCAFLAATYLTLEAEESEEFQELFRRRGMISGMLLGAVGLLAFPAAALDAPYLFEHLLQFPAILFMGLAAFSLVVSMVLIHRRSYWWARTFAISQVVFVFCAWAWAQYPYLIVGSISIFDAASPPNVLVALLILSFFYAAVLGPSLVLLLKIFKGGKTYGQGDGGSGG